LGLLYSTVTAHLGFKVNNGEYKVMGLSPYGNPEVYYSHFKKLIKVKKDGSFRLDMSYFQYHYALTMPSPKFIKTFGPMRKPTEPIEQRHKDIAASLQKILEETLWKALNYLYDEVSVENLCMAGGVALNSVANGKIRNNTPFKNVYIQPASSDAGGCIGAAVFTWNTLLKNPRTYVMDDVYLGPEFSRKYIKTFLDTNNVKYKEMKEGELIERVAELIAKDKIIGWFQGRMEWGPRALGNRSILANPLNPKMKDILNSRVKHREGFRPFAPVVCEDDAKKWFEVPHPVPFMLFVYPVKKDKRELMPSITHVDGSARVQTVTKEQNPRYYNLIKAFGKITGVPVLINTSFNVKGEPIVCTPEHAYRCAMGTGIDYLVLENFLIAKRDNVGNFKYTQA